MALTDTRTTGGTVRQGDGREGPTAPDGRCPECESPLVTDEGHGEVRCSDCGLVVDADRIDPGPEWRSFEGEENSRVGAPTTDLIHDRGLSTTIDWRDRDAQGNVLNERKRRRVERLRTWDERFRTRDHDDRNLRQALAEIDRMASALAVPGLVRETASVVYRRALREDLLPGRSIEAVATASLHAAVRQAGVPRSMDELARVSRVDREEFERAYRYLLRQLDLEVRPPDPAEYVPRIASAVDLPDPVRRRVHELLETGKEEGVHSGKSPMGVAAAAVYAATLLEDEPLTQATVADAADVSTVTVRNRYQELLEAADVTEV